VSQVPGRPVYWDIPDANLPASNLAKELGFAPQRSLVRMFWGGQGPPFQPERQFGIAGPAMG
jgi:hypothetical protein